MEMQNLVDKENVYLLASYARILNEMEKKEMSLKNIGMLFTPEGKIGWEYEKAFPIPGENLLINSGPQNIPFLDTPYGRIGQVICYDMHFPHYINQAAAKNIDLLISPSYDGIAWTPLHTFNGGMRAVENGFTMVRITGDGHSGVIDPYFRLWSSQDSFEQGTTNFYYNVPVISHNTIYGIIGLIFPYICIVFLISLIVVTIVRVVKMRSKRTEEN